MEEKAMVAFLELIEVYASTLTNYIKKKGDASLGNVANDVMALAQLVAEVNDLRY